MDRFNGTNRLCIWYESRVKNDVKKFTINWQQYVRSRFYCMCSFFILSWPGDLLLWRFLIAVETSDSVIGS